MQCVFCGHQLAPGESQCSRCGGSVAPPGPPVDAFVFSNVVEPDDQELPTDPSAASLARLEAEAAVFPPAQAAHVDPEAGLRTAIATLDDRQQAISTKIVEASSVPEAPAASKEKKGLPESRVSRGVEDSLLDIKRMTYRLGWIGRLALYSHVLVVLGVVSPWYYMPHEGYTPGIEGWGVLVLAASLASIGMLVWRHRHKPTHRTLPVVLHMLFTSAMAALLVWRYQENQQIGEHLRPELAFGAYATALGAAGAALGSLLGLKNAR